MKESDTEKGHSTKSRKTRSQSETGIELTKSAPRAYFYRDDEHRVDLRLDQPARGDRLVANVGPIGGIHKDIDNAGDEYYVKRETTFGTVRSAQVIAEYVAGSIFHDIYPDSFPEIHLAVDASQENIPDRTGQYIYVASKMFKGYKPLYKGLGYDHRPKSLNKRDKAALNKYLRDSDEFVKGSIIRKLFGDDDAHIGNKLVKDNDDTGECDIKDIDFGTAFLRIKDNLDPHASREQPMPWPHSHYINDYPRNLHTTKKTVEVIKEHSKIDFKAKIAEKMNVAAKLYGIDQLVEFARYVGMKNIKKLISSESTEQGQKEKLSGAITEFLGEKIQSRQKSLEKYGAQIELGLILKDFYKDDIQDSKIDFHEYKPFKRWVKENQGYAFDLATEREPIHFRHKEFTVTESYNQLERFVLWLLSLIGIEPKHYKQIHNGIGQALEDQGREAELREAGYVPLAGEEERHTETVTRALKSQRRKDELPIEAKDEEESFSTKRRREKHTHENKTEITIH